MNNRGAMGGTNVPAAAPPAAGPGAMIPDGAMGMVMQLQLCTFEACMMLFPLLSTVLLRLVAPPAPIPGCC